MAEIVLGNKNTSVSGYNSLTSWKFILKKKPDNMWDKLYTVLEGDKCYGEKKSKSQKGDQEH